MDDKLKQKAQELQTAILNCALKAAKDFVNDKPVDSQGLQTLFDSIRILHHMEKIHNNTA